MGNARNVAGCGARSRRRPVVESHYLTAREASALARQQRVKDQARGIHRRWNGGSLQPPPIRTAPVPRRRRRPRLTDPAHQLLAPE